MGSAMDNPRAVIGGNAPPDAIETIQAAYDDLFAEVANWLDGSEVQTEAQMNVVNELLASVKACEKEADAAKENEYRPHKAAGDAVVQRWKPFLADLALQRAGLIKAVDAFKRRLAAEKDDARKEADRAAWEATRKAQEAARAADASNIEATRAAAQAQAEAEAAQEAANAAKRDTVKGMYTVHKWRWVDTPATEDQPAVSGARKTLNWVALNDRSALTAFLESYVQSNFKTTTIDGVERYTEKEAR